MLPCRNACILCRCGLFLWVGKYGQIAVGFQNGELHRPDVQHILFPQVSRQLVQIDPGAAQIVLKDFPVVDEDHRLAAKQLPQIHAAQNRAGQYQLQSQYRQDRHQPGIQWDCAVLHGNRRKICHQHGHHEFRRLHFADLPLAHEPYGENQHQVQEKRAKIG